MLKNTIPLSVLVEKAKQGGYDFLALTDDNLHGMIQFFELAKQHHLKPIIGLKIECSIDLEQTGFLVYVKNEKGYQNLLSLLTIKGDRILTFDDLIFYQEGLVFVTSGLDSMIDKLIQKEMNEQAYSYLLKFKQTFKDFYMGLCLDSFDQEFKIAPILKKMSEKSKVDVLPIHQTSYLEKSDGDIYEALIKIDSENHEKIKDANYAFMDKDELEHLFLDYPDIFNELHKMVDKIEFTWKKPAFQMPIFPVKDGTPSEYLRSLAILGLKKRLKKIENPNESVYQNRLLYELDVIHNMGFDSYFLIVYDFVRYAKMNQILVGPGRGSSAGSLVAYCLGITDVDPITYDLLFERFLNPERITMPDIDLDFPDDKRDMVLKYVQEKYGKNHVVSIVTFGTFAVRSSIRDIARVMKIDPQRVNGIVNNIINDDIDPTDEELIRLQKAAKKIEGLPRHKGTHAAGIILAEQDLTKYIPLQSGINDFYQSQLEQKDLESLGLLKIDFLGIRNLSIIDQVIQEIKKEDESFNLLEIPLDDQKTYELLSQAETNGIFQLESMGMRNVLKKLKPNQFEDIVALLALYRPGPMDQIDTYIRRRNHESFDYIHESLKPILEKTYGIIIYQEQIMRIANEFAGYTLAEADILRRAVSKKDRDTLEHERKRFIQKCKTKHHPEELAEIIYDYIVKFADYGFNRSHSVAYALVAYQMAYLKANYFPYFMTALLSNVIGNEQQTSDYLNEIKTYGIKVSPPSINKSSDTYIYFKDSIYLPLNAIKSIGRLSVQKILEERKKALFKDYQDFKLRMKKEINEKNIEMLIHSGALDEFDLNHPTMLGNKQIDQAGYELYITDYKMKIYEDDDFMTKSKNEKEALGFNIIYHPLYAYEKLMKDKNYQPLSIMQKQDEAIVLAFIKDQKTIKTKQGKPMMFVTLDDGTSQLEATLFSETYKKYQNNLHHDVQVFKIRSNRYREQRSFVIEWIENVKEKQL